MRLTRLKEDLRRGLRQRRLRNVAVQGLYLRLALEACVSLGRTTGDRSRAKGLILRCFPYSNVRSPSRVTFSDTFFY